MRTFETSSASLTIFTMKDMIHYTGTYADQYQLSMAHVYFKCGRSQENAVFDYFFRKLPFGSGFVLFAGLESLLDILESIQFSEEDITYLEKQKFDSKFIHYLKNFRFKGNIFACKEGEVVFPNEPVLRVEGSIIEAQIIETLLLNIINFQSLIATKASRMRNAAPHHTLLEFGLRRAQGPGGYYASRASIIGGFDGTSHVKAAIDFDLIASGTMAHSFIQSEIDEITAFRKFAEIRPENCVFLLDTFNTLESGLPNAIQVAKEMEKKGNNLFGVRLDSGDLAYLSTECRRTLDQAGLHYVKIIVSNQLDENVIKSLMDQGAPIDIFGVGTKLVVGHPDGALDGVYKLSEIEGYPKIKISESMSKVSLPHKKQIYRMLRDDGTFLGADAIGLLEEKNLEAIYHPIEDQSSFSVESFKNEELLIEQMRNGKRLHSPSSLEEIKKYAKDRLNLLPAEYKRFTNPHIYKVGLTQSLKSERNRLMKELHGVHR